MKSALIPARSHTMLAAIKRAFTFLLAVPEANSRLVFLMQGTAGAVAILVLTVGFVYCKETDRSLFPEMLLAACGGGLGAAWGRNLTKKVGPVDTAPTDKPDSV